MKRVRPAQQIYAHYTPEDFEVWSILFNRQMELLQEYGCDEYLRALRDIQMHAGKIPDYAELNKTLQHRTQWTIKVVQGHVPPSDFFEMLSQKIFPATCWLRTRAELDYIDEPDMFHDIFGHVPLLIIEEYAAFMQEFGKMALKWVSYPDITEILSRVYWFTIEFGLLQKEGRLSIYGAGILSSPGETRHSMSKTPEVAPFDISTVIQTGFKTDVIQDLYFTIESFDELRPALSSLDAILFRQRPLYFPDHWEEKHNSLYRQFVFRDFAEAFAFMQQVAALAEAEAHHPLWTNLWNRVEIWLNTHDAGAIITQKDMDLARKINRL